MTNKILDYIAYFIIGLVIINCLVVISFVVYNIPGVGIVLALLVGVPWAAIRIVNKEGVR